MKTSPWTKPLFLLFCTLVCLVYFWGIPSVPFHPDESTQIYTSADVNQWMQDPFSLAYSSEKDADNRMRYRLIDSPITRTLIGWGLRIRGQTPVAVDWDWSKTWAENDQTGALPALDVLLTARWSVAWMFPVSCFFLFFIAKKLGGWGSAILAILLMATNALILIHTRRAMAESALICLLCASMWGLLCVEKRFWLSAIGIGLAVNSKQITTPLAGIGFLNVFFHPGDQFNKNNRLLQAGVFTAIILIISWILNPVIWKSPVSAMQAGIDFRSEFTNRVKTEYFGSFYPVEQSAILLGQVFIEPPAVADVINYDVDTQTQVIEYFRNPINNLYRGFIGGAIFLGLTIFGWVILFRRLFSRKETNKYTAGMFLAISAVLIFTIVFFTPVHYQRYYVALVPPFIIAQAIALSSIGKTIYQIIKKGLPRKDNP